MYGFTHPSAARVDVTAGRAGVEADGREDAGLAEAYHADPIGPQEQRARKARRQSTSMMKPPLYAITAHWVVLN